jgi:uncharacterized protein (TIGR03437 family)
MTVVVNNITVHPGIYYTSPTQVAAVLPSNTPAGTGTITVTYNNQTSGTANLIVVASAMGFDTAYGIGTGLAIATDNSTGAVIGYTHSASWGQVLVLWGSGVGADISNDDRTFPLNQNNLNYISALYVGGVKAQVLYQGRSQYPGVDQIDIIVPQNVSGCYVGITAVSGTGSNAVSSNTVTLPVEQNGGICNDTNLAVTGDRLTGFAGAGSINLGTLTISQLTSPQGNPPQMTTATTANGLFVNEKPAQFGSGYGSASLGSCIVSPGATPGNPGGFSVSSQEAGTLTVTGGSPSPLTLSEASPGVYSGAFAAGYTLPAGQSYTFNNGNGGVNVQSFTFTLTAPSSPLTWTNMPSSVTRSQGVIVNWTGGDPKTDVMISGSSAVGSLTVSFTCFAPASALTFTVPPYITQSLPAGNGSLTIVNRTAPVKFSPLFLDSGYGQVTATTQANVSYQ